MSVPDAKSHGRISEIDSLRGLGALAVLAFHLWPETFSFAGTRVDLFFVLSGYLISGLLLRNEFSLGFLATFWARRILRTWPAYYLLILYLSTYKNHGDFFRGPNSLWHYLLFCQNTGHYWAASVPSLHPAALQTWSLAIEEQFYFLFPVIAFAFGKKHILTISVLFLIDSVVARFAGLSPHVALARCDGMALGAILAVLNQKSVGAHHVGATLSIGLLGFCLMAIAYGQEEPSHRWGRANPIAILGISCLYYVLLDVVINKHGHPLLRVARFGPLVYLGQISYGIYLYHGLIILEIETFYYEKSARTDALAILATVAVSAASWEIFEKRISGLKRWIPYPKEARSAPAGPIAKI